MGVKTIIDLQEVNTLFAEYNFTEIIQTSYGTMDTTYIVKNEKSAYILKKYEREMGRKIETDQMLLKVLCVNGFNTPQFLCQKSEWYLYTKLKGESPSSVTLAQIQALARFMASFHNISRNFRFAEAFLNSYNIVR
uniref:phosphotransferase n=1 Tax=Sulfurimonas sp. TaxID=2022749 RepID=UPI0026121CB4